jgi:hypothetical protein
MNITGGRGGPGRFRQKRPDKRVYNFCACQVSMAVVLIVIARLAGLVIAFSSTDRSKNLCVEKFALTSTTSEW